MEEESSSEEESSDEDVPVAKTNGAAKTGAKVEKAQLPVAVKLSKRVWHTTSRDLMVLCRWQAAAKPAAKPAAKAAPVPVVESSSEEVHDALLTRLTGPRSPAPLPCGPDVRNPWCCRRAVRRKRTLSPLARQCRQ